MTNAKKKKETEINKFKNYKDSSNPYAWCFKWSRDGDFMLWKRKMIKEYETRKSKIIYYNKNCIF